MRWNSWDCFGAGIWQADALANADYIHAKGLKFGLHLMRGIPRQAVDRDNAPIVSTPYHAEDIADRFHVCGWNSDMYRVDMLKPGARLRRFRS